MLGLSNPELGVLMLALFVVFIMFGFPIAFTLMALGVFFGYFAMGDHRVSRCWCSAPIR